MGLKFHGVVESRGELYGCRSCLTYITSAEELTSSAFTGSTGPAILFKRAWNVTHGDLKERGMTTGMHIVRDVHCSSCKMKLGWMYEMALVNSQIYKEGQVILENALVCRISLDMKDPAGEETGVPVPPNIETSRHRKSSAKKTRSNSESGSSSSSSSSDFYGKH
ncbi:hypothetical protein GCK72_015921 [Caenorhabditis remanei]|uniref:Protein yippee-like n=1 Tax=Caenorhabditis remanei TaxID=31234 RepID=A0A6A5GXZ1_CAERE|nr:hypothetical protein GCK72_015921 [Caenorhabditis remanei]KAF1759454.1 hypothetical protein GCK72_015921 [Caenorhabditis remanei]